ncbi:SHOCT-like domain-containing protein [Kurthia gibsonii]|uniref:SHOCT-like domain-containing protein n=1 Tax=Kurthia gibsonii TaxID=33946 RepID=UPI00301A85D9
MQENLTRILTMVQDGTISVEQGTELIELLKTPPLKESTDKILRVRIQSDQTEKVEVNLPITLAKILLQTSEQILPNIPQLKDYVTQIDLAQLSYAVEHELTGTIVDIQSANDDYVSIFIEEQ